MIVLNRILVPIDFSDFSDAALLYAVEMARAFDAELHLLNVMPNPALAYPEGYAFVAPDEGLEETVLRELRKKPAVPESESLTVQHAVRVGTAFVEIVKYAEEHDVDLIVLGTHGRTGVTHMVMGSVAEKVVRKAGCPVLTVRPIEGRDTHFGEIQRVLVPMDFSEHSEIALLYGCELARQSDAELHLMHVLADPAVEHPDFGLSMIPVGQLQDELRERVEQDLEALEIPEVAKDLTIHRVLRTGVAFSEIIHYAETENIDLVIVGTHGRNALAQLLIGSVAEKVVRRSPCPVLSVRHPEHEFVMP